MGVTDIVQGVYEPLGLSQNNSDTVTPQKTNYIRKIMFVWRNLCDPQDPAADTHPYMVLESMTLHYTGGSSLLCGAVNTSSLPGARVEETVWLTDEDYISGYTSYLNHDGIIRLCFTTVNGARHEVPSQFTSVTRALNNMTLNINAGLLKWRFADQQVPDECCCIGFRVWIDKRQLVLTRLEMINEQIPDGSTKAGSIYVQDRLRCRGPLLTRMKSGGAFGLLKIWSRRECSIDLRKKKDRYDFSIGGARKFSLRKKDIRSIEEQAHSKRAYKFDIVVARKGQDGDIFEVFEFCALSSKDFLSWMEVLRAHCKELEMPEPFFSILPTSIRSAQESVDATPDIQMPDPNAHAIEFSEAASSSSSKLNAGKKKKVPKTQNNGKLVFNKGIVDHLVEGGVELDVALEAIYLLQVSNQPVTVEAAQEAAVTVMQKRFVNDGPAQSSETTEVAVQPREGQATHSRARSKSKGKEKLKTALSQMCSGIARGDDGDNGGAASAVIDSGLVVGYDERLACFTHFLQGLLADKELTEVEMKAMDQFCLQYNISEDEKRRATIALGWCDAWLESLFDADKSRQARIEAYYKFTQGILADDLVSHKQQGALVEYMKDHNITFEEHMEALNKLGKEEKDFREAMEKGAKEEDKEAEQNLRDFCVTCWDKPVETVCEPCGHVAMCSACAERVKGQDKFPCPVCRTTVMKFTRVFHAGRT